MKEFMKRQWRWFIGEFRNMTYKEWTETGLSNEDTPRTLREWRKRLSLATPQDYRRVIFKETPILVTSFVGLCAFGLGSAYALTRGLMCLI